MPPADGLVILCGMNTSELESRSAMPQPEIAVDAARSPDPAAAASPAPVRSTSRPGRPLSLSRHAAAGAVVAAACAALWVAHYLLTTTYGYLGLGLSSPLSFFVLGLDHGMGEKGAEALFVVVTRFALAFGVCWGPAAALLDLLERR